MAARDPDRQHRYPGPRSQQDYTALQRLQLPCNALVPLREDDYRYPGPKPHTKETAIVMLADAPLIAIAPASVPA